MPDGIDLGDGANLKFGQEITLEDILSTVRLDIAQGYKDIVASEKARETFNALNYFTKPQIAAAFVGHLGTVSEIVQKAFDAGAIQGAAAVALAETSFSVCCGDPADCDCS